MVYAKKYTLIIKLLLYFVIISSIFSCNNNNEDSNKNPGSGYTEISIKPDSIEFDSSGGNYLIQLTTKPAWKLKDIPEWIKVDQNNGIGDSKIQIIVDTNSTSICREAKITITAENSEKQLYISQLAEKFKIVINPNILNYKNDSSTQYFNIDANISWELITTTNWITTDIKKGSSNKKIAITARQNRFIEPRTTNLKIQTAIDTLLLTVNQEAGNEALITEPSALHFGGKGGEQSIVVTSASDWIINDVPGWLVIDKTSGHKGISTIYIKAKVGTSISRQTTLIFSSEMGSAKLLIKQDELVIKADNVAFNIDGNYLRKGKYASGEVVFNIDGILIRKGSSSSGDVMFSIDGEYIKMGRNGNTVFYIDDNYIRNARNRKIVFSIIDNYITKW